MTTKKSSKIKFITAVGRRKTASARVQLFKKKGSLTVNGMPIAKYFPGKVNKVFYLKPFQLTNTLGKYSGRIKVAGSGKKGQLGAVIHGLSRVLIKDNLDFRPVLKKAGLLTRDSRKRERRKAGLAHSARAKKISPKR